jgi:hypothetical protein
MREVGGLSEASEREIGLLYLSVSTLRLPAQAGEVDAIVDWSHRRNRELDVTGALVFTERRFAQYLEGPEVHVDALMASIARDPRHRSIDLVARKPLAARRFATWAMAYAGPSTFVAGHVLAIADAPSQPARAKYADRLIDMMGQFVQAQLIEQRREQGR